MTFYQLHFKRRGFHRAKLALFTMLACSFTANADFEELSNTPLFLGAGVKPNVLLVLDDSGSMESEVLVSGDVRQIYEVNNREHFWDRKDSTSADFGNLDMTPNHAREYLESCVGYNSLAYNPEVTYEPWFGFQDVDIASGEAPSYPAGISATDDVTAVYEQDDDGRKRGGITRVNHFGDRPGGTAKLQLALYKDEIGYVPWTDSNDNNKFDEGECGGDRQVNVVSGHPEFVSNQNKSGDYIGVTYDDITVDASTGYELTDFTVAPDPDGFKTYAEMDDVEKQNFANWYSYHRNRRFVTTGPLTTILGEAELRAGIATINRDGSVGLEVDDLSEESTVETGRSHREVLLEKLVESYGQNGSTPLRRPLLNAGLYYEGKQIDSNFVSSSTTPDSPILSFDEGGSCQQNYTLLITDGYSNEKNDDEDVVKQAAINDADGDANTSFDGGLYADNDSDTLADIAMHFYERDLATHLPDDVSSSLPRDTNDAQHMVTYAVAFGVTSSIDGFPQGNETNYWPDLDANTWQGEKIESLDDLVHAAYNGRGDFLNASNGQELEASLRATFDAIAFARTFGTSAGIDFSTSGDLLAYGTTFDVKNWSGNVFAVNLENDLNYVCPSSQNATCSQEIDVTEEQTCPEACVLDNIEFDALDQLQQFIASSDVNEGFEGRNIFTFNEDLQQAAGDGVEFPTGASLQTASNAFSQRQLDDLLFAYNATVPAANQTAQDELAYLANIVDYIRGDGSNEGSLFRSRAFFAADGVTELQLDNFNLTSRGVLGDIANSTPQYVAAPNSPWPDNIECDGCLAGQKIKYQEFVEDNENRTPMIYVGANDGMLHAFNASTGVEEFAYIPSAIFSSNDQEGLHWYADPSFALDHKYYVDGTPTVRDVFDGQWKSILVSGLGGGGKAIFGLDVTEPENFDEDDVLFEFEDDDLGFTTARPQIAKLNNTNGDWGVIFGNGYGNTGTGTAKLFIIDINGGIIREIDTGVGSVVNGDCADDASDCNGLSEPTLVDINGDAIVDRIYAGDLHGNMWVFDVTSDDPINWGPVGNEPFFVACNGPVNSISGLCPVATERQPITSAPSVVGHTSEFAATTAPNLFVLFGTGQYLTEGDIADDSNQSFYGVWDSGSGESLSRNDLVLQEITTPSGFRELSDNDVDYGSLSTNNNDGWYVDLPESGERSIISPIVVSEIVLFATSIPNASSCEGGGSGFLMAADIFTGGQAPFQVFDNADQSGIEINPMATDFGVVGDDVFISTTEGELQNPELQLYEDHPSGRASWSIIK